MGNFERLNEYYRKNLDIKAIEKRAKQVSGEIPTFCGKCGKIITKKLLYFSEKNPFGFNHTEKCNCGCAINYYNKPDEFHKTEFYLKVFRSKFKDREKNFKKVFRNGKTKFIKS